MNKDELELSKGRMELDMKYCKEHPLECGEYSSDYYKTAIECIDFCQNLVYCNECEFWDEDKSDECGCGWCRNISRDGCTQQTGKEDYCSYGISKTEEKKDIIKNNSKIDIKHGHWTQHSDAVGNTYYACSACYATFWECMDGEEYCPCCGAKMDGVE